MLTQLGELTLPPAVVATPTPPPSVPAPRSSERAVALANETRTKEPS